MQRHHQSNSISRSSATPHVPGEHCRSCARDEQRACAYVTGSRMCCSWLLRRWPAMLSQRTGEAHHARLLHGASPVRHSARPGWYLPSRRARRVSCARVSASPERLNGTATRFPCPQDGTTTPAPGLSRIFTARVRDQETALGRGPWLSATT
jgi:hypothetical protein